MTACTTSTELDRKSSTAIRDLRVCSWDLVKLAKRMPRDACIAYNRTVSALHSLMAQAGHCAELGLNEDQIYQAVEPAVGLMTQSPLLARMRSKPRGCPGDFETIEYICDAENRASVGSFGWYFERHFLNSALLAGHRNKIQAQVSRILRVVGRKANVRILALGAGGARDLHAALDWLVSSKANVTVSDSDAKALELAQSRLSALSDRLTVRHGNALKLVRDLRRSEPFDLVIAGGFVDYIPDRLLVLLLWDIYAHLLKAEGLMFFSSLSDTNDYRALMRVVVSWAAFERSQEQLVKLAAEAGIDCDHLRLSKDPTGITYFVECER